MDPQDTDRHQCPLCLKSYKRREHLQRHCATHSTARPHRCVHCDGTFQRLDVLKRHARTCAGRTSGLTPLPSRRRACDLCVQQKKACSGGTPCRNCERHAVACRYCSGVNSNRDMAFGDQPSASDGTGAGDASQGESAGVAETPMIDVDSSFGLVGLGSSPFEDVGAMFFSAPPEFNFSDPSAVGSSWFDFLALVSDAPGLDNPSQLAVDTDNNGTESKAYSFKFLDNFTSHTGLIESFDCGTPELRQETVTNFLREQSQDTAFVFSDAQDVPLPGVGGDFSLAPSPTLLTDRGQTTARRSSQNPLLQEPLLLQVHQIVIRAREVINSKSRNSIVTDAWSLQTEQDCLDFFSPQRMRKFLCLYWTIWHPNVNLLHYPTFDALTAKPVLLAAMAIIGSFPTQRTPLTMQTPQTPVSMANTD